MNSVQPKSCHPEFDICEESSLDIGYHVSHNWPEIETQSHPPGLMLPPVARLRVVSTQDTPAVSHNEILCRCLKVTHAQVEQAITVFSAETVQEVASLTEAGTGCMCCRRCIRDLIRQKQAAAQTLEIA